jgi:hypothetical protein
MAFSEGVKAMNLLGHSWSRVGFYLLLLVALLHGKYVAAADVSVSIVLKEDIFAPQEKHVHASTLVQAPSGGFLAAWFHGSGERTADDVVIQASWKAAGSEHWGKVFILDTGPCGAMGGVAGCVSAQHGMA